MAAAGAADELQVVISYGQSVPVTAGQIAALKSLGIGKGITMRTLPGAANSMVLSEIFPLLSLVMRARNDFCAPAFR